MRYTVTEAGNNLDIGGIRRRAGETITLNQTVAGPELSRETIVEYQEDTSVKSEPESKGATPPKGK